MPDTPSPSADAVTGSPDAPPASASPSQLLESTPPPSANRASASSAASSAASRRARLSRRYLPQTSQGRLTLAFVAVVALTLALVALVVLNRLDEYFYQQDRTALASRTVTVRDLAAFIIRISAAGEPVVDAAGTVNPRVDATLNNPDNLSFLANQVAFADVVIRLGTGTQDQADDVPFVPAEGASYAGVLTAAPAPGQARESIQSQQTSLIPAAFPYAMEVSLSDPYTYRQSTFNTITGLLLVVTIIAFAISIVAAAFLASRFTRPLRRLTEAVRRISEGDLSSRVPIEGSGGAPEVAVLSHQFNRMAARLEESVEVIRRDRDRSRDFLADVSHELRTPIAALRTFNELVREQAADDPEARREFLEASSQQIDRLDWLAQNLLELSKLDSGLVLLELRPDDLRACVEAAAEHAEQSAERRGVNLQVHVPDRPVRIHHDPQRVGQVITNLVGNALKFTPRGGTVEVEMEPDRDGAIIRVRDNGPGIDPADLPRVFERFYRGGQATEARSSGSGLGLSIVKSIVDMHGGRISVQSQIGHGSVFTVFLPRDPRIAAATPPSQEAGVVATLDQAAAGSAGPDTPDVAISSPAEGSG